ncbi:MAG: helix-turn-helix transcriptional regulator [Pseudomonadota bacterium]
MNAQALVARNLRKMRVRKGISQEALAVDAKVDRTYVSRVERGLENPTVAVLEKLAMALDGEISNFFERPRAGEATPKPLKGGRKPS